MAHTLQYYCTYYGCLLGCVFALVPACHPKTHLACWRAACRAWCEALKFKCACCRRRSSGSPLPCWPTAGPSLLTSMATAHSRGLGVGDDLTIPPPILIPPRRRRAFYNLDGQMKPPLLCSKRLTTPVADYHNNIIAARCLTGRVGQVWACSHHSGQYCIQFCGRLARAPPPTLYIQQERPGLDVEGLRACRAVRSDRTSPRVCNPVGSLPAPA